MKGTLGIAGAAVVLTLSLAAPVAAQERGAHGGGGGGERHNSSGGGGGGGQAVERGGGGAMSSGSSDGGGFSGASSSGGSAGGGFSTGPGSATAVGRISSHPGPSPLGHAAFRDRDGARLGDAGGRSIVFSGPMGAADPSVDPAARAVPPGSRPNRSNPPVGTAVERSSLPNGGSGGGDGYYNWYDYYTTGYFGGLYNYYSRYGMLGYYSPYAMYYGSSWYYPFDPDYLYGYGAFGIGSFYYDPTWWGGAGYGGVGGGGYSKGESSGPKGGLKLRITPDTAAVYVDGTYYGIVDQFNSAFQRLELPVGTHHIELQAKGYQPLAFDVSIDRNDTVSYRGTMTPGQQK